jgi:predicted CXXCH cytochrome family protein
LLAVAVVCLPVYGASSNPHWKAGTCTVCHDSEAPTVDNLALKTTPGYAVCADCHDGGDAKVCRHRSDIGVSDHRLTDIDATFQPGITDGKVGCTTCHEMKAHCARDVKERYRNPSMLRGAPYSYKGDMCFSCHATSGYRKPSPHNQGRASRFKKNLCIYCHGEVPAQDEEGQWLPVKFATDEPLSNGCHNKGPHPSSSVTGKRGWFHMSVPDDEFKARMQETVNTKGGRLPLDPNTGEVTCATCHDPHDDRLSGFAISEVPGDRMKLRYDNMCGACHEK